jgi:hypothetical protein
MTALLTEQLRDEFIQERAPDFHRMALIRVLLKGVGNLQLIQALDEFFGPRARYRILAAGCDVEIADIRGDFVGCLERPLERLRFAQYPGTEDTKGGELIGMNKP